MQRARSSSAGDQTGEFGLSASRGVLALDGVAHGYAGGVRTGDSLVPGGFFETDLVTALQARTRRSLQWDEPKNCAHTPSCSRVDQSQEQPSKGADAWRQTAFFGARLI